MYVDCWRPYVFWSIEVSERKLKYSKKYIEQPKETGWLGLMIKPLRWLVVLGLTNSKCLLSLCNNFPVKFQNIIIIFICLSSGIPWREKILSNLNSYRIIILYSWLVKSLNLSWLITKIILNVIEETFDSASFRLVDFQTRFLTHFLFMTLYDH